MPTLFPPDDFLPGAQLTSQSLQSIKRIASWARWFLLIVSTLLFVGAIGLWLPNDDFMPSMVMFLEIAPEQSAWLHTGLLYRLVGFVITLVPALLLIRSMNYARHMLDSFTRGHVLTLLNAMRLRSIASLITCFGIAFPLSKTLTGIALTINNPPEHQVYSFYLNLSDIMLLGLGVFLWVLSWAMVEAARVVEENNSFV